MRAIIRFIVWLYAVLLRLYPREFREMFGAEMHEVFEDVIAAASARGTASLAVVCVRELLDLFRERLAYDRQKEIEAMPERTDLSIGWAFWLRWVLASVGGAYVGGATSALVSLVVSKVVGGGAEDRAPTEILLGAGLGIAQWLVLRRRIPRSGRWTWATIAGALVFAAVSQPLGSAVYAIAAPNVGQAMAYRVSGLVDVVTFGAFLGLAQWLVLRGQVAQSGWWLVASAAGYGIAMLPAGKGVSSLGEVVVYLVVPPAITGFALVRLLSHPSSQEPGPASGLPEATEESLGDRRPKPPDRASPTTARDMMALSGEVRSSGPTQGRAPWWAAVAAALPLAGYALSVLMAGTMRHFLSAIQPGSLFRVLWANVLRDAPMPVIFYLPLLTGLVVAWTRGFPRWSYPYLGWLAIVILFGLGVSGPADLHLWLTWGPLLSATLLAILLRRPSEPLQALWRKVRQDWTQVSFALIAILGFLVLSSFDEMPGPRASRAFWEWLSVAILVLGALWYMRAPKRAGRIAALLGSAVQSVLLSMGSIAYFWHNYPKPHIQPPLNGYRMFRQGLVFMVVVVVLLLVPAVLCKVLNRRLSRRSTG
jgi:hypothetical protein